MQVHARFRLYETARVQGSAKNQDGKWVSVECLRVKLAPVTGEPFGSATPQGELMMVIANSEAAGVFDDAKLDQQFDVVFSLVEAEK